MKIDSINKTGANVEPIKTIDVPKPTTKVDKVSFDTSSSKPKREIHTGKEDFVKSNIDEQRKEINEKEKELIKEASKAMNQISQAFNKGFKYTIHEASERIAVRIINLENNEVIKELPPEEFLDMVAKIHEMVGTIFDKKA